MKTFSQASFGPVASTTNLPGLVQNHSTNHSMHAGNSSMNNSQSTQRSLSVPNDTTNHVVKTTNRQTSETSRHSSKKDKSKRKHSVGDPGKVQFVKVDVDNNMVCANIELVQ